MLLNYDFVLGMDTLDELGIIFSFKHKTIQEGPILMKPHNCTAKEFCVIQENRPVQNTTKRIRQI